MNGGGLPTREGNAQARPEIIVSEHADWALFDAVAIHLSESMQGHWTNRLDGLDQRYWELACADGTLTLHLESFAGISLFVSDQCAQGVAAEPLLARARTALRSFVPPA